MALAYFILSLLLQYSMALCIIAIPLGSTLSTTNNSFWLSSPSGDFAFGFHQVEGGASYLLSIWYAKIPETIVWYAGQEGVLAPKRSLLTCTADQGLRLKDPHGGNLWSPGLIAGRKASYCLLNDAGNLMIKGAQGGTLWQSFDNPRDTLMPSQMTGNVDSEGPILYSRHSESEFTRGRYQLRLLDDGDLVLNKRNLITNYAYDPYYSTGTNDSNNASNSGSFPNKLPPFVIIY